MKRVDDRKNDRFDRRHYAPWCGVWRDREGNHYQRFLLWHPGLWWEIFMALVGRPGSSIHPVIQAAAEKAVAEDLGADPDKVPDWDSPERQE